MRVQDLRNFKEVGGTTIYKCPKCKEWELRPERIGHRDEDFNNWEKTGIWICDNPKCEVSYKENSVGDLYEQ